MIKRVRPFGQLSFSFTDDEGASAGGVVRPRRKKNRSESSGRSVTRDGTHKWLRACLYCQKPVDFPEWLRDEGFNLLLCSGACRKAWAKEQVDPPVEIGTKSWTHGANWEQQKRLARDRDGYACRICRVTEEELRSRLHVHHHIPYGSFRSNVEANKLEHLISVCPSCHGQLDAALRRELPLFAKD